MNHIIVKLSLSEIQQAAGIATQRNLYALKNELEPAHGHDKDVNAWETNLQGCFSEMAVAKHYGIYYNGSLGDFHAGDVGKLEVRSTYYANGSLMLHRTCKPERKYILVTIKLPILTLRGWILASDGMQEKYWMEKVKGRPAYFIPQSDLHPMNELKVKSHET